MSLTTEAVRRLESALHETSQIMAQNAALVKATLPQSYTLDQLETRYARGRVALRELLQTCGVWPAETSPGRTTLIPLDAVLLVDAVVNGRLDPSHLPPR
jgi:hypothetical protein